MRAGKFSAADIDNIAEELECLARREKREPGNLLTKLLAALLRWQFQPGYRGLDWKFRIKIQRRKLAMHLRDTPSLQGTLGAEIEETYWFALLRAQLETGLPEAAFPTVCPYGYDEMIWEEFWPD